MSRGLGHIADRVALAVVRAAARQRETELQGIRQRARARETRDQRPALRSIPGGRLPGGPRA